MIAPVMFLCRSPLKPIVSDRYSLVISLSMHHGPPNASSNMSSPIPYETYPLHQAFPPITFAPTVQKACRFRQSSSNDVIFLAAGNGEKSQARHFDCPYLSIEWPDRRSPGVDGDGDAEPIGKTSGKPEWNPVRPKKRGATQGLPSRSPILVLLSPKYAKLRSSDGTRCISAGMIAPVMFLCRSPHKHIVFLSLQSCYLPFQAPRPT